MTATAPSMTSEMRRTPRTSDLTSSMPSDLDSAAVLSREDSERRRTTTTPMIDAKVMTPKPPIWISNRMTTCPNPLQCVAVSTMTCPVTHRAETAVNSASIGVAPPGPAFAIGSSSSPVPIRMPRAKPPTVHCAGCGRRQPRVRGAEGVVRGTELHYACRGEAQVDYGVNGSKTNTGIGRSVFVW